MSTVVNFTLEEGQIYNDSSKTTQPDRINRDSTNNRNNENINTIEWRYYPNPTRDYVTVEVSAEIEFLFVTDLNGKLLQKVEFNGTSKTSIYLGDYPVGIYLLRYPVGKQWVTGKLVLIR